MRATAAGSKTQERSGLIAKPKRTCSLTETILGNNVQSLLRV